MLAQLNSKQPNQAFPHPNTAEINPDGLLAVGGCLSPQRLINAYQQGIFPWFSAGEPLLWWSPNPRLVLFPEQLKISRSLRKTQRKNIFTLKIDSNFEGVIQACAKTPRQYEGGTWISDEMQQAYQALHQQGVAHSVEAWCDNQLVGGLYGLAIGQVFFGESMFHHQTDASKIAFSFLVEQLSQWGYQLIDCQVHSEHLVSLGAVEINRDDFLKHLQQYCPLAPHQNSWENG